MDSNSFLQSVLKDMNTFRAVPSSLNKRLQNAKLTISRFRGNEQFVKDADNYINFLALSKGVTPFTMAKGLNKVAEKMLEDMEQTQKFKSEEDDSVVSKIASDYVQGFDKICQIVDQGAENTSFVLSKILLNKQDKAKRGRNVLLDDELRFIGMAHKVINDENTIVIVLTDRYQHKDAGNVDELKLAFDLFDVHKMGKIDPSETVGAMKSFNYDQKNPTLFDVMQELDTPENRIKLVDFDAFVNHITTRIESTDTEDDLRRTFNLFIDDPSQDTITLTTLKKICKEIGEDATAQELKDMLDRAANNSTDLTFEEFYIFMTKKYIKN